MTRSRPELKEKEVKKMIENKGEMLAKILNLCESDPDIGLEFVEQIVKKSQKKDLTHFGSGPKPWHMVAKDYYKHCENFN